MGLDIGSRDPKVILGTIALYMMPAATLATALALGWLLLIQWHHRSSSRFRSPRLGGFFLHLACGVLGIFIGLMVVTHPVRVRSRSRYCSRLFLLSLDSFA
jgi:uncharacterized membrane protein HdeD (DUF308 family)